MQHSNPSSRSTSFPFSSSLAFWLDEARARGRVRAAAACAPAPEVAPGPSPEPAPHPAPVRVGLAELLGVLHGPVEWVFSLAERAAIGDGVDIAAIHRVRDAVRLRMAAAAAADATGVAAMDCPRIRPADLLTVSGLLLGTIDPSIMQHLAMRTGERAADLLATVFQLDPGVVACFASPAVASAAHACGGHTACAHASTY